MKICSSNNCFDCCILQVYCFELGCDASNMFMFEMVCVVHFVAGCFTFICPTRRTVSHVKYMLNMCVSCLFDFAFVRVLNYICVI